GRGSLELCRCHVAAVIGCLVQTYELVRDRASVFDAEFSRELPGPNCEVFSFSLVLDGPPVRINFDDFELDRIQLDISFRFEFNLDLPIKTQVPKVYIEEQVVGFDLQSGLCHLESGKRVASYTTCGISCNRSDSRSWNRNILENEYSQHVRNLCSILDLQPGSEPADLLGRLCAPSGLRTCFGLLFV